jgi:hypothetical protein
MLAYKKIGGILGLKVRKGIEDFLSDSYYGNQSLRSCSFGSGHTEHNRIFAQFCLLASFFPFSFFFFFFFFSCFETGSHCVGLELLSLQNELEL